MEKKIKILYLNKDMAGVNYYRTLTPAVEIEKNHKNIHIEVNQEQLDVDQQETMNYLKSFDIIHYHGSMVEGVNKMKSLASELKEAGVVLVMDIDDYWELPQKHPLYPEFKERRIGFSIVENLKLADYITTTTEIFANEIRKITGRDNVTVLYNSIDTESMKQFQNNWQPDPDGKIRITYMGGSSHLADLEQLKTVVNGLNADYRLKDKFKIILAGWDTEGLINDVSFNEEFKNALIKINMWNLKVTKIINQSKGNVNMIPKLPKSIADQFRDKVFIKDQRKINSNESVYYKYEMIFTDNHRIIKDLDYINWLKTFNSFHKYNDEGIFCRRWTQKANSYANVLNESDIVLAPLDSNKFNTMKSNLKQVECISRKLPIVCSDLPPYNVDGKHMENCVLIPFAKNSHKDWQKYLTKLILDADLRKQLGEGLYNDFSEKYSLKNVTNTRVAFYESILVKETV